MSKFLFTIKNISLINQVFDSLIGFKCLRLCIKDIVPPSFDFKTNIGKRKFD